jgi:hypothetical protein
MNAVRRRIGAINHFSKRCNKKAAGRARSLFAESKRRLPDVVRGIVGEAKDALPRQGCRHAAQRLQTILAPYHCIVGRYEP